MLKIFALKPPNAKSHFSAHFLRSKPEIVNVPQGSALNVTTIVLKMRKFVK
jgi:hypothetical protein